MSSVSVTNIRRFHLDMAVFKPFPAIRPRRKYCARTLCPPYDVVSRKEASDFSADPVSFMRVIRTDAALPGTRSVVAAVEYMVEAERHCVVDTGFAGLQHHILDRGHEFFLPAFL